MEKLKVGAGKAVINPPAELFPFKGWLGSSTDAVKDDVHVRAIVIDNGDSRFLFLSYEPGRAPGMKLKQEIAQRYGLDVQHILASSIHNHSCPHWGRNERKSGMGTSDKGSDKRFEKQDKYNEIVIAGTYEAIDKAVASLRPARYGYGEGKSYINANRDGLFEDGHWMQDMNLAGISDKTLAVVKFEDYEGRLIAAILNYAAHATGACYTKDVDGLGKVTPAFPGYACNYVESRYGGDAVVMWTSGCAADQNVLCSPEGFPRSYDPVDGYSETIPLPNGAHYIIQKYMGQTHGVDAIKTLKTIECKKEYMKITTSMTQVELEGQVHPEGADIMYNRLSIDNMLRRTNPELFQDGKRPKKELYKMIPQGVQPMMMQLSVMGDVAFLGVAGELYTEIGWHLKEACPFKNLVIVTHADRNSAEYILSDESADHDVFQSYSLVHPGSNNKPIVEGMLTLFDDTLNKS